MVVIGELCSSNILSRVHSTVGLMLQNSAHITLSSTSEHGFGVIEMYYYICKIMLIYQPPNQSL